MTRAIVTIKTTPQELRVMRAALKMYAHVNRAISRGEDKDPLKGFQHDLAYVQGDPRVATVMAGKLLQEIG